MTLMLPQAGVEPFNRYLALIKKSDIRTCKMQRVHRDIVRKQTQGRRNSPNLTTPSTHTHSDNTYSYNTYSPSPKLLVHLTPIPTPTT